MDTNDYLEIQRLSTLKKVDMFDKESCLQIIRKYINEGASYCLTCDPAVRAMFVTLKEWAANRGIIKTNR